MRLENPLPFTVWTERKGTRRGMSIWHNLIDWVGSYLFEAAKPEAVFDFVKKEGFVLLKLETTTSHANNQFVFKKVR